MSTAGRLVVEFLDDRCQVGDQLSFGRAADLVLDADNRYLHAEAGRLRRRGSDWFVYNTGSRLHLELLHETGLHVELPPKASARIPKGYGRIRVAAGGTLYEFGYVHASVGTTTDLGADRSNTLFYGRDLTPAQVDYAVTLARFRLLGLHRPPPTQAAIAELWCVSTRAVNKTFEDIRTRLRNDGVQRISTQEDLLEYLVLNRIVTIEHLEAAQLDRPTGPIRRSEILERQQRSERRAECCGEGDEPSG